uniref:Uncharacterized protein n=1 Tax=Candidatus Kentrum sp. LPFa TaxID=2126335 RepID=A0A450WY17_9GAMM|nr:MAG: hypothetical protein BECKLPF1236B_GA0070989_12833 [Candidatus Kentron sp. LPFa]
MKELPILVVIIHGCPPYRFKILSLPGAFNGIQYVACPIFPYCLPLTAILSNYQSVRQGGAGKGIILVYDSFLRETGNKITMRGKP